MCVGEWGGGLVSTCPSSLGLLLTKSLADYPNDPNDGQRLTESGLVRIHGMSVLIS